MYPSIENRSTVALSALDVLSRDGLTHVFGAISPCQVSTEESFTYSRPGQCIVRDVYCIPDLLSRSEW